MNSLSPKTLLLALIISVSAIFVTSSLLIFLGDRLFIKDHLNQAETLYKIVKATNLFNQSVDQRLLAVKVVKEERRTHSEETDIDRPLAENNRGFKVLGTSLTVPVLMYHYIRINPNPNDTVGFNLSVTPANFTSQMDYLASHGYHTISLDEMGASLLNRTALPGKPIVITFDDGYRDAHDLAFPILRDRGFKALNFVITGLVGAPNYLTWDQIDEMKASGLFTFGGHTVHHYALTYLNNDKVKYEVTESKNILQTHLGYNVNWFAYPYGNVDGRVATIVAQAGYVGAFGTNSGTYQSTNHMFTLPRVRVGGGDGLATFAAKLPWK